MLLGSRAHLQRRLPAKISFRHCHAAKSVSDNIVLPLDVRQLGAKLLNQKSPSHYAFSVEVLIHQVLVISKDFYFVPKENIPIFLECLYNT
jgi:hypothetical protein